MEAVRLLPQFVCSLLITSAFATIGCHGQVPAPGSTLPPELARRVEILIRQRTHITPDDSLTIGPRQPSDIPGYDKIEVTFHIEGDKPQTAAFFLSKDGNSLAQFNKYDISKDPKTIVSGAGRPARGGPASAPVEIVVFDDLECPFCARMHNQLFPEILKRYGDSVRIVYRDYPASKHPWAMRAAIDTNCVAAQSPTAYWSMVDYIHAHADDFGGADHSLQKALDQLDQLSLDQAKKDHLNIEQTQACIKKQDDSAIKASIKIGEDLSVDSTPTLFINGEEFIGAYPLADVFRVVDQALVAAGKTPPPPYSPPSTAVTKEGN